MKIKRYSLSHSISLNLFVLEKENREIKDKYYARAFYTAK